MARSRLATSRLFALAAAFAFVAFAAPAFAGIPINVGGYVWFDENCDGTFNDGAASGLNGVRVMYYRDYECDGVINNDDEIYDYDFTSNDADGNPGYFSVSAVSDFCFVTFLDPAYVPEGLKATTGEQFPIQTVAADYTDAEFGLGVCDAEPPAYTCPKTIGFWKQQIEQTRAAKYSRTEIQAIVTVALTYTDVFSSYRDFQRALDEGCSKSALDRAKKQYAGFLLNLAAYDLRDGLRFKAGLAMNAELNLPRYTNAKTVGEVAAQLEQAISSRVNLGWANDTADAINNGQGLDVTCTEEGRDRCSRRR